MPRHDGSPWFGFHWSVPMIRAYRHRMIDDRFYGVTIFGRFAIGVIVEGKRDGYFTTIGTKLRRAKEEPDA